MDGARDTTPLVAQTCPPRLPANWYMLAGSAELTPGKLLTRSLFGRDYVLYRAKNGDAVAYHAACAHMGCHLKHAVPEADGVRCALHHRRIGLDGRFAGAGGLVQPRLTLREHLGGLFVWQGRAGAETALPQPRLAGEGPVMTRMVGRFAFDVPWYALVANGFDMEHLASVHGRALREPVLIDTDTPGRFRLSYRSRVTGRGLSDRVVKRLSRNEVRAAMTTQAGSLMLVESDVARPSFAILSMQPRPDGGTLVQILVGANGDAGRMRDALRLRVAAWLFRRFFEADVAIFDGLDWHPPAQSQNTADRDTRHLWRFFCAQEEAAHG